MANEIDLLRKNFDGAESAVYDAMQLGPSGPHDDLFKAIKAALGALDARVRFLENRDHG